MASKTIEIDIGSDDVSSQQRHEMALVTGIIGEEVSSEENKKVRSKKKKKQSHSKKKKKKSQKIKDNITKEQKRTIFVFFYHSFSLFLYRSPCDVLWIIFLSSR